MRSKGKFKGKKKKFTPAREKRLKQIFFTDNIAGLAKKMKVNEATLYYHYIKKLRLPQRREVIREYIIHNPRMKLKDLAGTFKISGNTAWEIKKELREKRLIPKIINVGSKGFKRPETVKRENFIIYNLDLMNIQDMAKHLKITEAGVNRIIWRLKKERRIPKIDKKIVHRKSFQHKQVK